MAKKVSQSKKLGKEVEKFKAKLSKAQDRVAYAKGKKSTTVKGSAPWRKWDTTVDKHQETVSSLKDHLVELKGYLADAKETDKQNKLADKEEATKAKKTDRHLKVAA